LNSADLSAQTLTPTKSGARDLSLSDAILLSLAQNPSFAITRLAPSLAEQEVLSAKAIYDTIVRANAATSRDVAPSESSLSGTKITTEQATGTLALDQKLPTGADLSLAWDNSRTENDARFTSLSPAYRSSLSLSLSQPLLRGTGWGAPGVLIRIARSSSQVSKDLYESQVADQVRQVVQAYWSEVRARELVEVRKREVELSERLQSDVEEGVKVGQLAPLSLSEANAQIALSREQLIVAENQLLAAGRTLRQITGIDFITGENGLSDFAPLRASDRPEVIKVTFDPNQSVELALAHRAELRAQKERLRLAELSAKLASNQVLPELNLEGRAGLQGLAGTDRGTDSAFGGSASPYQGGYGDALDDVGSKDFYDYTVGLRLRMPLENREARAEFNRKKIGLLSEQHRLRALTQSVIEETLAAISSLEASSKRVKAAQEAVAFSRQSLEVQRDKLNAGLATVRDMLETQRDFSEAELRMAEALTDFSTSLSEVLRARGELLEHYHLKVDVL
jgi:outer membrane protein TolC